ncbi:threonine synthase [Haliangium sp.]|uniref:threonine synthase n=1 Tax=Haliangium sp. TaxID=2663208 RepID=UPI003D0BE9F5
MPSFVTHLEAAIDGTRLAHDQLQTTHQGRPLWVRYDLDAVAAAVTPADVAARPPTLWRYRELLPVERDDNVVTLGEGMSPLLPCPRLGAALGLERLWIKDESQLPTGSFKSRGLCMAVSRAKELGARRLAIPTAGNAGGALAAYAARAGLASFVFMPADTPVVNRIEAALYGAKVFLIDGLITDCGQVVQRGTEPMGWFDVSTLKEPYRIEGKKTMGLELAEQLGWRLPDAIFYPTGGGTGLIGMWKAFAELGHLGWIDAQRPRMFACQSDGCAPIVRAFEAGARFAEPFPDPHTAASGLRVPKAVGDFMILDAVRESGGRALAAPEASLLDWTRRACALEGVALCPEAAACVAALADAVASGEITADAEVVVFNTGAAQKYVEALDVPLPRLGKDDDIDWASLAD